MFLKISESKDINHKIAMLESEYFAQFKNYVLANNNEIPPHNNILISSVSSAIQKYTCISGTDQCTE